MQGNKQEQSEAPLHELMTGEVTENLLWGF